ncbi:MAG: glycosyltransferase [Saprospiraceae bacterium]|nr:glycosyltransferase [Saprospiraceae bacterium]
MNKQNILFITKINFGNKQNAGYHAKVRAQSNALRSYGLDVDLMYFSELDFVIENPETTKSQQFGSRLGLLWYMYVFFPFTTGKKKYQGIYIRHFLTNPLFIISLFLYKLRGIKIVMEVPTYPYSFEYKGFNKNKFLYYIDQFCAMFFRFFISRIVSFSFDDKIFGIKTIKTDNGVEVDKILPIINVPPVEDSLHVLGLGNPRVWHAYERIIEGMKIYYQSEQKVKVIFDVVGQGGELQKYIELVKAYGLEQYVKFHGYRTGKELDEICSSSHLAVASLGMHRINVANGEASPLKAREFAARGIPFITGYLDKGFPTNFPFILNFPSDESPINIETIVKYFIALQKSHPDYPIELRNYAAMNLDWKAKMLPVVEFFNSQN